MDTRSRCRIEGIKSKVEEELQQLALIDEWAFPMSVDDVWKILGHTYKKTPLNAVKNLLLEGVDYQHGEFYLFLMNT